MMDRCNAAAALAIGALTTALLVASCFDDSEFPDSWTIRYHGTHPALPSSAEAVADGKVIAAAKVEETFGVRDEEEHIDPRVRVREAHYASDGSEIYVGIIVFSTQTGELVEEERISGRKRAHVFRRWGSF